MAADASRGEIRDSAQGRFGGFLIRSRTRREHMAELANGCRAGHRAVCSIWFRDRLYRMWECADIDLPMLRHADATKQR